MSDDPAEPVDDRPWYEDIVIPALLRAARRTYALEMRDAQIDAGCDDLPRNGSFLIGAIARSNAPLGEIIKSMGISKQTASQLVDTLVIRGYLERAVDPDDRRRMTVSLTDRGLVAAQANREAIEAIDARLLEQVGPEAITAARSTLAAIIDMQFEGDDHDDETHG